MRIWDKKATWSKRTLFLNAWEYSLISRIRKCLVVYDKFHNKQQKDKTK